MLTGDREPNASVVAVATPDVENGKRRRSCPQISLFVQVFSVQNIPDTCSVSCLSVWLTVSRCVVAGKGRAALPFFYCLQRILVIKLQIWYFCDFQIGMSQPLNGALRFKWRLTRNTSFYSPETGSLQISREEQELPAVSLLQAGDYAAGTASVAAVTDLRPAVGRIPPR